MAKLDKNKNVESDKALLKNIEYELGIVEVAVKENEVASKLVNDLKNKVHSMCPTADKDIIKADEKIFKKIEKLKKRSKKDAKKGKFVKSIKRMKMIEIEIVERGCFSYIVCDSKTDDFEIVDGVLKKYIGCGGDVIVPSTVVTVGEKAFYSNNKINTLTFQYGLKNIGDSAVAVCDNLVAVTLPEGVVSIGDSAFYNCKGLEFVTVGEGIKVIGRYAFNKCYALEAFTLTKSLTSLGDRAFGNCKRLSWKSKRRIKRINKEALK